MLLRREWGLEKLLKDLKLKIKLGDVTLP